MKIIFFGTHEFATTILQGLIDNGIFDIDLVITQPDKPVGRKQELQPSPVKILAEKYNLKVDQPSSLKTFDFKTLETFDLGVCAQYGLIIPEKILSAPKFGTLNVHTSLLPKYRGASPIQTALINGETETGVTIMKMDAGMDTGPIILQKTVKIDPDDTYPILDEKLAKIGIFTLLEAVPDYVSGKLIPQPQDNAEATTCKLLDREDGKIDWSKSAGEIYNQYRGLTPWPGVWTTMDDLFPTLGENKRIKLLKIALGDKNLRSEDQKIKIEKDRIFINCNNSVIEILELQLEGSNAMDSRSFINGYKNYLK
ncbi:MAG: methionyl-tRNA formyltransferase [Candidatus Magasanikiibacteriota bacterium]